MPIHVHGVLLHAMSGTELSRVRTELRQRSILPTVPPHPVQANRDSPGHGHFGDRYLRTLLVQGAHYILGPFGQDSDLRRWGLKLSERGGRNAKKRAVVAVARKLAVLLHKLWVSKEVYEPLRNNRKQMTQVA